MSKGVRGAANVNARLDPARVRWIRILLVRGVHQRTIAQMYDISQTAVSMIARGVTWRWVE